MFDLLFFDVLLLEFDDPFHGLTERDRLAVAVVEVEGMGKIAGGFQQSE